MEVQKGPKCDKCGVATELNETVQHRTIVANIYDKPLRLVFCNNCYKEMDELLTPKQGWYSFKKGD